MRAFEAWTQETNLRFLPRIGLGLLVSAALWWPLDRWAYAGMPQVQLEFVRLRSAAIVVLGPLALLARRVGFLRRRLIALAYATSVGLGAVMGGCLAGAGPASGPWPVYLSILPAMPTFVLAPLRQRVLGTVSMVVAILGSYVVRSPEAIDDKLFQAAANFLVFTTGLSIALGAVFYRILQEGFVARHRLQQLTANLEERLDEKTVEIRRIGQHAEQVREEERRRIASDLHDELGQQLAAMRFALAFARTQPGKDKPLGELDALLDRTHATVRSILAGLRPRVLDELGLVPALRALCREMSERSGLVVRVTGEATTRDSAVSTAAFRIVQEAITNAIKHAGATRVEITVSEESQRLRLEVSDDGRGLDGEERSKGLGLLGIRERARALGGDARWESREGLRLQVELPQAGGSA